MPELSDDGTDDSQMSKVRAALTDKLAAILMLIYIAIRFHDVKFGASAVIALLHDVAMVFCLYIILRLTVGNTCIACLLTIVGYSINATIIIFDRIRENIDIMRPKKATYKDIVNLSIIHQGVRSYTYGWYNHRCLLFSMYHRSTLVHYEDKAWQSQKRRIRIISYDIVKYNKNRQMPP